MNKDDEDKFIRAKTRTQAIIDIKKQVRNLSRSQLEKVCIEYLKREFVDKTFVLTEPPIDYPEETR